MKNRSDQVVLDEFRKWVGGNEEAIKDQDKWITFGKEYCNSKDRKFVWKTYNKEVSTILFQIEINVADNYDRPEYERKNTEAKWS